MSPEPPPGPPPPGRWWWLRWPGPARLVAQAAVFVYAPEPVYRLLNAWRPSCTAWASSACQGGALVAMWCYLLAATGCGLLAVLALRRLAGWDRRGESAGQ